MQRTLDEPNTTHQGPGNPVEESHVHVRRADVTCTFRLNDGARLAITLALIGVLLLVMTASLFASNTQATQVLPTITGLLGTAIGYFFGGRDRS